MQPKVLISYRTRPIRMTLVVTIGVTGIAFSVNYMYLSHIDALSLQGFGQVKASNNIIIDL